MTRIIVVMAIIAQVSCFPAHCESNKLLLAHKEPAVTGNLPVGNLVVVKKRIPEGSAVRLEDVEIEQADAVKIPINAFRDLSDVVGKKARYYLEKGSIISSVDVWPGSNSKISFPISLSPRLFSKLQAMAKRQKISESAMAEKLLEQELNRISPE